MIPEKVYRRLYNWVRSERFFAAISTGLLSSFFIGVFLLAWSVIRTKQYENRQLAARGYQVSEVRLFLKLHCNCVSVDELLHSRGLQRQYRRFAERGEFDRDWMGRSGR